MDKRFEKLEWNCEIVWWRLDLEVYIKVLIYRQDISPDVTVIILKDLVYFVYILI
jgi:hypothetical protein